MKTEFYDLELETKPDFVESMKRIYAWYDGEILDRAPVRFLEKGVDPWVLKARPWPDIKAKWFDTRYQVENYMARIRGKRFLGETFPVFFPNLGPNIYGAALGGQLIFDEYTSWLRPFIKGPEDIDNIRFDPENEYWKKIMELTDYALERCEHQFMVGYTDIHTNLDCLEGIRGGQDLLMDMYDDEAFVDAMMEKSWEPFKTMMDLSHERLQKRRQLSVTWLNVPFYEPMHIPSCDIGAMVSTDFFERFAKPVTVRETKLFEHNIFHLDGRGVARHLDSILDIDSIGAIQWVQGAGDDKPIMQWVELIKKIQAAGKGVIVDVMPDELEQFMDAVRPKGIYLCVAESSPDIQQQILNRVLKWK